MPTLLRDLRYGIRMMLKHRTFAAIAVITLALGIGANTVIFSVVSAVLLRPLPFPDSDRIVRISEGHATADSQALNLTYATFLDLGKQTSSFEHIGAARFWSDTVTDGDEPQQVSSMLVSSGFLPALGVAPALGRIFRPEEDQPGGEKVVIISDELWRSRYAADPSLIGKTIKVSSVERTVIGVMPRGFQSSFLFRGRFDVWLPLVPGGALRENRRSHLLGVVARLKPEATIQQAQLEMAGFASRVEQQNPGIDPELSLNAARLQDRLVAPVRPALTVLWCAVGCVLLIACANVANLLLARAASREKEMAIRLALGASRWRILRQLLTESVLLGISGGAAGLLLAVWGLDLLKAINPGNLPRLDEVRLDGRVLAFTLLTSLLTGIVFGLALGLELPRFSLHESVREGGRGVIGSRGRILRQLFVVTEVALALVLLVGAGLLINSFMRLQQVDRGFDPQNVLTLNLTLPHARYATNQQQIAFLKQAIERVAEVPGARSVGLTSNLPLTGGPATDFVIEGREAEFTDEPIADITIVDANYFRAMSIPLRSGRTFSEHDSEDAPRVMIINENMAHRFWPDGDPIGRRVTMKDWGPPLTGEVVGVAADVKAGALDSETRPMIYWPYTQFPMLSNNVVVRTDADPLSIVPAVKGQIWSVDREQPIASISTMEQVLAGSVAPRRFNMLLLGLFAGVALLLAVVGIYGVMSYTVEQRTQEIGIRMALGARSNDVMRMIVVKGMTMACGGLAAGTIAAMGLTRLMASLLYHVSPTDATTFGVTAFMLGAAALVACYIPARRATKVDPMVSLRCE